MQNMSFILYSYVMNTSSYVQIVNESVCEFALASYIPTRKIQYSVPIFVLLT